MEATGALVVGTARKMVADFIILLLFFENILLLTVAVVEVDGPDMSTGSGRELLCE